MDTANLFTAALRLPDPWKVGAVEFRDVGEGGRELHMGIGFEPGSRFPCPQDGCVQADCVVHDTRERVWRHLDFFQHKAFIHAAVPRVIRSQHGVGTVGAPWARPGSGFTLLFEAWAVEPAKHMPVSVLAGLVGQSDTRLRRFIAHYAQEARRLLDCTGAEAIGIDETSRKGHGYITVAADPAEHDVVDVTPGKDSSTVGRFARDFMDHNGVPEYVRLVTRDMSPGFRKGVREHLPNARRIVDRFHVIKHASEAVDEVGKTEGRGNTLLKKTKYLWLGNERSLSPARLQTKRNLMRQRLKTARACRMREALRDIYQDSQSPAEAYGGLTRLCSWMMHSRLEPMKRFAALIRRHWHEIMAYFHHPYANAILEGLNSIIQNIKRRARGLRNMDYFATMIYLNCSNLDLKAVTSN
jgi:transposase